MQFLPCMQLSSCHIYPSRRQVHEDGCLSIELDMVYEYAGTVLGLTLVGLITSVCLTLKCFY